VKQATLMIAMLVSITANATPVAEMKKRTAIDEAVAKAAENTKDCGKKFTIAFDWKAFDSIDWDGIKRKKDDYYGTEHSNVVDIGAGLNQVCADKDYKAALAKINKVTYRTTNDDKIRVKAVINGDTMILDNYSFGSTRGADDYATAVKAAL